MAELLLWLAPLAAVVVLFGAYKKAQWVSKQDAGTDRMKELAGYIAEGAMAYLSRQYRVLAIFVIIVAVLLGVSNAALTDSNWVIAIAFICGAVTSAMAGFAGMRVATKANVRTAAAARNSLESALRVAFGGGTVMGLSTTGLALIGLSVLFLIFKTVWGGSEMNITLNVLAGFSLGASSIALFARVGGGIYTKAADVGADLVGKVEAGIPEDDPRNPATIADNVGDNVGDVAGMGADLFESYVGAIIGAMVLGLGMKVGIQAAGGTGDEAIYLPIILAALGALVSMWATKFVKIEEGGNPQSALNKGSFGAAGIMVVVTLILVYVLLPWGGFESKDITGRIITITPWGIFIAMLSGLLSGVAIGLSAEYYCSPDKPPVQGIAKASETGSATNIIAGLAVGMKSTTIPVLLLCVAIILSYYFSGLYGIAIAALGMLSTLGIQLAVDAYGPISDNAGGIAEMSKLGPEVRKRTDKLDAVGNTTAAIGKGFAIGSAALTAMALFSAYISKMNGEVTIDVTNPYTMAGLFLGAMLPFLFSSMAMTAVGEAAQAMIEEVRRQFREIPGIMEGTGTPEFAKCVSISTDAAIRKMILPGAMAIVVPVVVGLIDPSMLGGVLAGVTVSGLCMAIFQSNAGGAWDNAKKFIEDGNHGGKGSEAHKAAVTGDTVGDPFKDTSGPSINILIKLMSVVAMVIAPLLYALHYAA